MKIWYIIFLIVESIISMFFQIVYICIILYAFFLFRFKFFLLLCINPLLIFYATLLFFNAFECFVSIRPGFHLQLKEFFSVFSRTKKNLKKIYISKISEKMWFLFKLQSQKFLINNLVDSKSEIFLVSKFKVK